MFAIRTTISAVSTMIYSGIFVVFKNKTRNIIKFYYKLSAFAITLLAALVTSDDDLRNCDSVCNTQFTDNVYVCAYAGPPPLLRKEFGNACLLCINNCKYPDDRKYI